LGGKHMFHLNLGFVLVLTLIEFNMLILLACWVI
jgi:hypothetical protein